jgi:hypothetical protein
MANSAKTKLMKLRGKGVIEVDNQIILWRKNRKKYMQSVETPRQRAVKAAKIENEAKVKARAYKMFEDES